MWGPGSIENFTSIWLPLVPPSGPAPTTVSPGDFVQLAYCNASDPTQAFEWATDPHPVVRHVGSGLCVEQGAFVDAVGDAFTALWMQPCRDEAGGNQTWYRSGPMWTNTSSPFAPDCVSWNTGGPSQGANLITYRCGNSTDWQSRFESPLTPSTPGPFQALSDAFPTGFCVAGAPQWNPALYQLRWRPAWRLADFATVERFR
jgi:hypothetical protein